jgi:rhomboid family GlyGly-CTERM serine protease
VGSDGPARRGRAPRVTLALGAACLLASAWPGFADLARLERAAVGHGEIWRLLTGHLVHASPTLLAADLLVLVALGCLVEARSRGLLARVLLASALGGSLAVLAGDLARYSGSSALASGLAAAAAVLWCRSPDARERGAGLGLLALLALKVALELGGTALFVPLGPGVRVAVEAHLGGALAGSLVALRLRTVRSPAGEPMAGARADAA